MKMCGLVHSIFVTLPLSLMGFDASYSAAKEWCARAGISAASTLAVNESKAARKAVLTPHPRYVLALNRLIALIPIFSAPTAARRYVLRTARFRDRSRRSTRHRRRSADAA